jgi:hypothetical protein
MWMITQHGKDERQNAIAQYETQQFLFALVVNFDLRAKEELFQRAERQRGQTQIEPFLLVLARTIEQLEYALSLFARSNRRIRRPRQTKCSDLGLLDKWQPFAYEVSRGLNKLL